MRSLPLFLVWIALQSVVGAGCSGVEADGGATSHDPGATDAPRGSTSDSLSGNPVFAHQADFLTNPDCPLGTTGYPNASSSERAACRASILARGYTHHYLSITSASKNWFTDVSGFKSRLQELVDSGIKPVVFITSDTGTWKDRSIAQINSDLSTFIPQIDGLVSSYALGIEIDEYWSPGKAGAIGDHLHTLTNRKVAAHQLPGNWDYCIGQNWCDYMILQYGFGLSANAIEAMTSEAIDEIAKPLVAGEYNVTDPESTSRALGNAAVAAGAAGFGNGGGSAEPPDGPPPVTIDFVSTGKTYELGVAEQSNAIPYIDRAYTIDLLSTALDGARMIRGANDDKNVTASNYLKLTVAEPSTIYVAYSGVATSPPNWLSGWTPTTLKLDVDDGSAPHRKVYRKSIPAGQVTLGGNRAAGAAGPAGYSNYVVVVK